MSNTTTTDIVQAINDFTFHLQKLNPRQTVCGVNVFPNLLLAASACENNSHDELVLALGVKQHQWESVVAALKELISRLDRSGAISNANSIWFRDDVELDTTFVTSAKRDFDAATGPINDQVIAEYVRTATNARINPNIQASVDTALLLVSCSYFKADWIFPFDACETFKSQFHPFDGKPLACDMMSQEVDVQYLETQELKAIILPYKQLEASQDAPAWEAVFILPGKEGQSALQGVLSTVAADWGRFIDRIGNNSSFVEIKLPKFQVNSEVDVRSSLETMGVSAAMKPSLDFWAVTPRTDMAISKVVHMTFLKCDELGTEVGAMTEADMDDAEADVCFHADRPFWMVIWDRVSGVVLSSAVVTNV